MEKRVPYSTAATLAALELTLACVLINKMPMCTVKVRLKIEY